MLSIPCLWFLGSIPAIILGILGIKNIDRSEGRLKGKGLAIAGIVTGGVGIVAGFVTVVIVASMFVPVMTKVNEKAEMVQQISVVRRLALGCMAWAADNDGEFPPDLESLVPDYFDAPEMLTWPAESGTERLPFFYQPGLSDTSFSTTVLIAAPEPMAGKRVVGYVSGAVEAIPEAEYETALEAGHEDLLPIESSR